MCLIIEHEEVAQQPCDNLIVNEIITWLKRLKPRIRSQRSETVSPGLVQCVSGWVLQWLKCKLLDPGCLHFIGEAKLHTLGSSH